MLCQVCHWRLSLSILSTTIINMNLLGKLLLYRNNDRKKINETVVAIDSSVLSIRMHKAQVDM